MNKVPEVEDTHEQYLQLKAELEEIRKIVAASNAWHSAEASIAMHKLRQHFGMPV